jgi:hypothetical protein
MTILEECLEVLGDDAIVLTEKETQNISVKMEQMFPISNWGRIDWEKVNNESGDGSLTRSLLTSTPQAINNP